VEHGWKLLTGQSSGAVISIQFGPMLVSLAAVSFNVVGIEMMCASLYFRKTFAQGPSFPVARTIRTHGCLFEARHGRHIEHINPSYSAQFLSRCLASKLRSGVDKYFFPQEV
jgi:hypothetical protein